MNTDPLKQMRAIDRLDTDQPRKNPICLLNEIQNIVCGQGSHQEPVCSMAQLIKALVNLQQEPWMSNEKCKEFDGLWDVHIQQGGNKTNHLGLIATEIMIIADSVNHPAVDHPDPNNITAATLLVQEWTKACFMLSGADMVHHTRLMNHCKDSYTMGCDKYMTNATELMLQMSNFH